MAEPDPNRYSAYLRSALSGEDAALAGKPETRIDGLLGALRLHLLNGGHAPDVIASEMAEANAAGDALRTEFAKGKSAPDAANAQKTPRSMLKMAALGLLGLLILAAYVTPLTLFYKEATIPHAAMALGADEVLIEVSVAAVDAGKESAILHLIPKAGAGMAGGRLRNDLALELDVGDGAHKAVFRADTPLSPYAVTVPLDDGDILEYPFDSYHVEIGILASVGERPLKIATQTDRAPHGFRFSQQEMPMDQRYFTKLTITRAGSIVFIAILAIASLTLVTLAALLVAWYVAVKGAKIEFSMMTWVAALLFVLPSVRANLPGSIPTGAIVDFAVFFWLQALTALATASLVVTWVRRQAAPVTS